jgi:hypothetical protein
MGNKHNMDKSLVPTTTDPNMDKLDSNNNPTTNMIATRDSNNRSRCMGVNASLLLHYRKYYRSGCKVVLPARMSILHESLLIVYSNLVGETITILLAGEEQAI